MEATALQWWAGPPRDLARLDRRTQTPRDGGLMKARVLYRRFADAVWDRLTPAQRRRLTRLRQPVRPGDARRRRPVSERYGAERGRPIDRYYIERFLDANRDDVQGTILEIKDSTYARRYGRSIKRVTVLDIDARNPAATRVADLAGAEGIGDVEFDCVILTQTLQYIADVPAAIGNLHRALKPGGVLLATLPAVARVEHGHDYWRFTAASARILFESVFVDGAVEVRTDGNVGVAVAVLLGMAQEDLSQEELRDLDVHYPVVVTARAVRGS